MDDLKSSLHWATRGSRVGAGGDTSVPDPLHPECTITFHCDLHGQHCTSTSSCGGRIFAAARGVGQPR